MNNDTTENTISPLEELTNEPNMVNPEVIELRFDGAKEKVSRKMEMDRKAIILDINFYDIRHHWYQANTMDGFNTVYSAVFDANGSLAGANLKVFACDRLEEKA